MQHYAPSSASVDSPFAASGSVESTRSAVSWAAIIAGAIAGLALSMILLALGSGIGFASVTPWQMMQNNSGVAQGITIAAVIWLIIVQWVSAGFGGYLTGRLRAKWVGIHDREVFFRDTAHGFLSWALSTVVGAALIASTASQIAAHAAGGMGAIAGMAATQGVMRSTAGNTGGNANNANADPFAYYTDQLFRTDSTGMGTPTQQQAHAEADRILLEGLRSGGVPDNDKAYLTQLVSAQTGLAPADATRRVDDVLAREKGDENKALQAINDARKATSALSIYVFISMLIGAFIASVSAALGGRRRDENPHVPT